VSAAASTADPELTANLWRWLRAELAPFPGRAMMMWRIVISVVIVVVLSMTLQIPETAVSAYMVLFVSKENRAMTTIAGVGLTVGVTLGIIISLALFRHTFDYPEWRIPLMAATVFAAMFLSRAFVIGPLGFAIGFVVAITQNMGESAPDTDTLTRALLWVWVSLVFPAMVTLLVHHLLPQGQPRPAPKHEGGRKAHHGLFVADAFTNPAYTRFALKVTLAAMACYLIYTGLDWPGIHTAFITCIFIALESTAATIHKAWLRLGGCMVGGALGFLSIMYLIPRMESIASLVLLTAAGTAVAGWVASGSQRIAYGGLQIGLAFFMCIFQDFAPGTNFTTIRDRLVGIVLGVIVSSAVFYFLWPDREGSDAGNRPLSK
jgi:uncharacterized membrane protein YccC